MTRQPYYPMRPKTRIPPLDRYAGPVPQKWAWQAKLDDERGIVHADATSGEPVLFNRHWELLASNKAKAFADAAAKLQALFPDHNVFDVALIGFRGHWAPGGIVLLDLPKLDLPWRERYAHFSRELPKWDVLGVEGTDGGLPPGPGAVVALYNYPNPHPLRNLFELTRGIPGVEGLIGRDPTALYQNGDTDRMVKIRWK